MSGYYARGSIAIEDGRDAACCFSGGVAEKERSSGETAEILASILRRGKARLYRRDGECAAQSRHGRTPFPRGILMRLILS